MSKVLAHRGAAKPCGKCGGDPLKFEFSHGKAAGRVALPAGLLPKLSYASAVKGLKVLGDTLGSLLCIY